MVYRRLVVLAAITVACGIDESGLMPGDASVGDVADVILPPGDASKDASQDVVEELPQSCTTLDVTACADAGIPMGWNPVITSRTVTACPSSSDASAQPYAENPQAVGCACGCSPTGSYGCTASIQYTSNCGMCGGMGIGGCDNTTSSTVDAGTDAACFPTGDTNPDFAIRATLTETTGGVSCTTSGNGADASSSPVTVCLPQCAADYCGVDTASYQRCIWSATQTTCPAPFTVQHTIGTSTDVTASCGCTCAASAVGSCKDTINVYPTTDCSGTPKASNLANPSCTQTGGTNMGSFSYAPTAPTATCDASAAPSAQFGSSKTTVCCLPP